MKKLLVFVLLLMSLTSFEQDKNPIRLTSSTSTRGVYNEVTRKWDYKKLEEGELVFLVYSSYMTVNDQAHSVYRIIEEIPLIDSRQTYSAKCLDEQNRNCILSFINVEDGTTFLTIVYTKVSYLYHLN